MAQSVEHQDGEALSEVNVIPLADLSLVLLIILMVISPMISLALIKVEAANAAAAQVQQEVTQPETPLIVSYAPGMLKFNGSVLASPLDLVRELDRVIPTRKDKSVILTASPELMHGDVVSLMDIIRRHGAESLTMVKCDANAGANAGQVPS
jgi:biopolymer transport protein ExbD